MFTQVFSRILDSSLRQQEAETRWLFLSMLIIGDEAGDGTVDMPVEALAARAALSEEATLRGLEVLMAPDPYSRSKAFEGRRLLPLEDNSVGPGRGWVIVNWPIYRVMANREARREQLARASKAYRLRLKEIQDMEIDRHQRGSRVNKRQRPSSPVSKRQQASSNVIPSEAEAEAEADTEVRRRVLRSTSVEVRRSTEEASSVGSSSTAQSAFSGPAQGGPPNADSEAHGKVAEPEEQSPPEPTRDEQLEMKELNSLGFSRWSDENVALYLRFYPQHRAMVMSKVAPFRPYGHPFRDEAGLPQAPPVDVEVAK